MSESFHPHSASHSTHDGEPDYSKLFCATPAPYLVITPDLTIVAVNDAYLRATRTKREALVGRHIFDAFPDNPNDPDANSTANLSASFQRVLRNKAADTMAIQKYDIRVGDCGEFETHHWAPVNTPVFGAGGAITHIIHRVEDVTQFMLEQSRLSAIEVQNDEQAIEIHLSNGRLREAKAELERERDLRELFVLALTHDLRTPLAAARFASQLLFRKGNDPAEAQRLSASIATSLERCERMISDLLDANQLRSGNKLSVELEPLELTDLVTDTLAELSTIYGGRFVLHAPDSVQGNWSRLELRRLIENLCINGVKYGAAGRPVTVRVVASKGQVMVEFHNEGPPIPPEDQAKLFEPYHRRAEHQTGLARGWGLGLTVVKGIAEAHGGKVEVTSEADTGTLFRVLLPWDASSID